MQGARPIYIYRLAPCTENCSQRISKTFLPQIFGGSSFFLVLLNPRNTRACFKQQYPRVLSKYSVVATIWLHRKKRKFIKNYDTRRYKEYSFSSLSANKGCKSTSYVIYTLYYTRKVYKEGYYIVWF